MTDTYTYKRTSPYHPRHRYPRSAWPAVILLAVTVAMVIYLAQLVSVAAQEMRELGTNQSFDTYTGGN